jgi:hypothetical protein
METELRMNLLACATAYTAARQIEISTLGRLAAGDWRFFSNLDEEGRTFTVRKYDEVFCWFSNNWPPGAAWPCGVKRPSSSPAEAA